MYKYMTLLYILSKNIIISFRILEVVRFIYISKFPS